MAFENDNDESIDEVPPVDGSGQTSDSSDFDPADIPWRAPVHDADGVSERVDSFKRISDWDRFRNSILDYAIFLTGVDGRLAVSIREDRMKLQFAGLITLIPALVAAGGAYISLDVLGKHYNINDLQHAILSIVWGLIILIVDVCLVTSMEYSKVLNSAGHYIDRTPAAPTRTSFSASSLSIIFRLVWALILGAVVAEPIIWKIYEEEIETEYRSWITSLREAELDRYKAERDSIARSYDPILAAEKAKLTSQLTTEASSVANEIDRLNSKISDEINGRNGCIAGCGPSCRSLKAQLPLLEEKRLMADRLVRIVETNPDSLPAWTAIEAAVKDRIAESTKVPEQKHNEALNNLPIDKSRGIIDTELAISRLQSDGASGRIVWLWTWLARVVLWVLDLLPMIVKMTLSTQIYHKRAFEIQRKKEGELLLRMGRQRLLVKASRDRAASDVNGLKAHWTSIQEITNNQRAAIVEDYRKHVDEVVQQRIVADSAVRRDVVENAFRATEAYLRELLERASEGPATPTSGVPRRSRTGLLGQVLDFLAEIAHSWIRSTENKARQSEKYKFRTLIITSVFSVIATFGTAYITTGVGEEPLSDRLTNALPDGLGSGLNIDLAINNPFEAVVLILLFPMLESAYRLQRRLFAA